MGHHTHPAQAVVRSLPFTPRLIGLFLLCLMSFWLIVPLSAAHAVTLPYNESFNGEDGTAPSENWSLSDLTGDADYSYHHIQDNALRIHSSGTSDLNSYYALFLDNISDNFTTIVQIPYITDTGPETRAGLIFQFQVTETSAIKGQLQVAVIPNEGFRMTLDGNGDGVVEETPVPPDALINVPFAPAPPEIWLKVEKSGDAFTGYYATDGNDWAPIGTVDTADVHMATADVGLFSKSGAGTDPNNNICDFDNFALISDTTTYLYYEDSDDDNFGNPWATLVTDSDTLPDGYVSDNTDCDDTDADINPNAPEVCDGKDNDCDGSIDEDVVGSPTTTYYWDGDGDSYGSATKTLEACSQPDDEHYVLLPGDCNDNDNTINPGAVDVCGNPQDEDCAGGPAVCDSDTICTDISDIPLSITTGGSSAIVMFVLDDSGNMEWSVMCEENDGRFNGADDYTDNLAEDKWKSQWYRYNRIYYNPNITYDPWPKSASYPSVDQDFPQADFNNARIHPRNFESKALKNIATNSPTGDYLNLTTTFTTIGQGNKNAQPITFGHYYVTDGNTPYLVDLGTTDSVATYYEVTLSDTSDHGEVEALSKVDNPPSEITIPQADLPAARRNFANWFTYYRTKELTTKASLAWAIQDISGIQVGIHSFNGLVTRKAELISTSDDVEAFLDSVYDADPKSTGTRPMTDALEEVGQYFHADDGLTGGIGESPFSSSEDGGNCQQAFAILMTSGSGGGKSPSVGDADGDNDTAYDGGYFAGHGQGTLPDVAMYYYERDLVSSLADEVPVQDPDYEAPHQRMVTYAVSFGIPGNFDPNAESNKNCPPSAPDIPIFCPAWAQNNDKDARVDELWHATVNGRGKYINTGSPRELSDAIVSVLSDITRRTGTAASVAVSSEKLDTGLVIYQGYFNSGDWSGNLEAYNVNSDGEVTITPQWSAKTQLNSKAWGSRNILTKKDDTGVTVAFRDRDALSDTQKGHLTQKQLNYLRGHDFNEVKNGGSFRNRSSKLGDIVHASPILHKGVVYVGANDGMFHAFDADDGDELFAYVPTFVYPNLAEYTSPYYGHKFYADGTATAKTVGSADWVVSGLRKGGKGFFGINVTSDPTDIWEYPTKAEPDDDIGFTYGEVTIAQGNTGDQLVFAANGYDSPNGRAVLLILKLDGSVFKKIDTGVGDTTTGNCNGLSDPLVVDIDDDGKADAVYAGDLLGNLWKFDVSSTDKEEWVVAYKTDSDSKPLFTARNQSDQIQPITSKPSAMFHCDATQKGIIVVFGTGRMLSKEDLDNTNAQTIYGIWDWQAELEANSISDTEDYHMGTFNLPSGASSVRTLSNISTANSTLPSDLTLLQQSQKSATTEWRYTSNNTINWFDVEAWNTSKTEYSGGVHVGWYMNLPEPKERVITKTQIRDGKAFVVSIIPEAAPCASGGTTVGSILSACNGGQLDDPQWDTNTDGVVDDNDTNQSGKKFDDDIYYAPAIIEDKLFFTKDRVEETADETRGLFYWRIRD